MAAPKMATRATGTGTARNSSGSSNRVRHTNGNDLKEVTTDVNNSEEISPSVPSSSLPKAKVKVDREVGSCNLGLKRMIHSISSSSEENEDDDNDNEDANSAAAHSQETKKKRPKLSSLMGPFIALNSNMYLGRTPLKMLQRMKSFSQSTLGLRPPPTTNANDDPRATTPPAPRELQQWTDQELQQFIHSKSNRKFATSQAPLGIDWEGPSSGSNSNSNSNSNSSSAAGGGAASASAPKSQLKNNRQPEQYVSRQLLQVVDYTNDDDDHTTDDDDKSNKNQPQSWLQVWKYLNLSLGWKFNYASQKDARKHGSSIIWLRKGFTKQNPGTLGRDHFFTEDAVVEYCTKNSISIPTNASTVLIESNDKKNNSNSNNNKKKNADANNTITLQRCSEELSIKNKTKYIDVMVIRKDKNNNTSNSSNTTTDTNTTTTTYIRPNQKFMVQEGDELVVIHPQKYKYKFVRIPSGMRDRRGRGKGIAMKKKMTTERSGSSRSNSSSTNTKSNINNKDITTNKTNNKKDVATPTTTPTSTTLTHHYTSSSSGGGDDESHRCRSRSHHRSSFSSTNSSGGGGCGRQSISTIGDATVAMSISLSPPSPLAVVAEEEKEEVIQEKIKAITTTTTTSRNTVVVTDNSAINDDDAAKDAITTTINTTTTSSSNKTITANDNIVVDDNDENDKNSNGIKIGSRVEIYWKNDHQYFPGTILKQRYAKKTKTTVKKLLLSSDTTDDPGTSSGTATKVKEYFVQYDDGDTEWANLTTEKFRCLKDDDDDTKKKRQEVIDRIGRRKSVIERVDDDDNNSDDDDDGMTLSKLATGLNKNSTLEGETTANARSTTKVAVLMTTTTKKASNNKNNNKNDVKSTTITTAASKEEEITTTRLDEKIQYPIGSSLSVDFRQDRHYYDCIVRKHHRNTKVQSSKGEAWLFVEFLGDKEFFNNKSKHWIDLNRMSSVKLTSDTILCCNNTTTSTTKKHDQEENVSINTIVATSSSFSTTTTNNDSNNCGFLGKRIEVEWNDGKYVGIVTKRMTHNKNFVYIEYDDGDRCWSDLRNEVKWNIINNNNNEKKIMEEEEEVGGTTRTTSTKMTTIERPEFLSFWDIIDQNRNVTNNTDEETLDTSGTSTDKASASASASASTDKASASASASANTEGTANIGTTIDTSTTTTTTAIRTVTPTSLSDNDRKDENFENDCIDQRRKQKKPLEMQLSMANMYWEALNSSQPREGAWYFNILLDPITHNTVPSELMCKEFMSLLTWGPQHTDDSRITTIADDYTRRKNGVKNSRRGSAVCSAVSTLPGAASWSNFFWDGPRLNATMNVWKKALRLYPEVVLPRMVEGAPGGPSEWWKTVLSFDEMMENEVEDDDTNINYKDNYLYRSFSSPADHPDDPNDFADAEFLEVIGILRMRSTRLEAFICLLESSILFEKNRKLQHQQQNTDTSSKEECISTTGLQRKKKKSPEAGNQQDFMDSDSSISYSDDSDSESDCDNGMKDDIKELSALTSSRLLHEIRVFGAKGAVRVIANAMARLWVSQRYFLGYRDDPTYSKRSSSFVTVVMILGSNRFSLWRERTEIVQVLVSQIATILQLVCDVFTTDDANNNKIISSTTNRRSNRRKRQSRKSLMTSSSLSELNERELKSILWNAMDMEMQKVIPDQTSKNRKKKKKKKDPKTRLLLDWLYNLRDSFKDGDFVTKLSEHIGISEEYEKSIKL